MHNLFAHILIRLLSILQASSLRDRYYTALNRIELLDTAIEDIARISESTVDSTEQIRLIQGICVRVQKGINNVHV